MFYSKLKVKHIKGTKNPKEYTVTKPLVWKNIKVPIGFKTDLATIPKQLQFAFKPNGKYSRASVLHDFLYTRELYSRYYADRTFLEAMKYDGVGYFTRYSFYYAVRLFAASHKG